MLNKEELNEKYGEVKVKFSSYFKYSFHFTGEKDSLKFSVSCGGDHNDIYKFSVSANKEYTIKELYPVSVTVYKGISPFENIIDEYEQP